MARRLEYHTGGLFTYGRTHVQTDWDYPSFAEGLGWSLSRVQKRNGKVVHLARHPKEGCAHRGTDGTVTCDECGLTAGDFINAASDYLHERAGS